jgi:hypothetical protein
LEGSPSRAFRSSAYRSNASPTVAGRLSSALPRESLGNVLRLIEFEDVLAVAVVEVVGFGEGLGPVRAVAVADLGDPG